MKTCSKCKETKPLTEFSVDRRRKGGRCLQCKTCQLAYRQQHRERERLRAEIWRNENPERKRQNDAAWRAANPERVRENKIRWAAENPDRMRASRRKHSAANPAKMAAQCRRRQAAQLQATPAWADHFVIDGMYELAQVFRRGGLLMEVDHVFPLRGRGVCGLHSQDNLQLLVRAQNARKSNRYPDSW